MLLDAAIAAETGVSTSDVAREMLDCAAALLFVSTSATNDEKIAGFARAARDRMEFQIEAASTPAEIIQRAEDAQARLASIARTRPPTKAERDEALALYAAAARVQTGATS